MIDFRTQLRFTNKGSLSISQFLSTYSTQVAQAGLRKRRKSGRSKTSNNKTNMSVKKINDRSRSNKSCYDLYNKVNYKIHTFCINKLCIFIGTE